VIVILLSAEGPIGTLMPQVLNASKVECVFEPAATDSPLVQFESPPGASCAPGIPAAVHRGSTLMLAATVGPSPDLARAVAAPA